MITLEGGHGRLDYRSIDESNHVLYIVPGFKGSYIL